MKTISAYLSLILCLGFIMGASATVRYVPGQYSTIQAGINACNPGDTVQVAPGIYTENLQMREGVSLFGSGMDATIVDGGGLNTVIYAYQVSNVVIADLGVRNSQQGGSLPGCAGIHLNPISSSGTKIVRRCHIYNNGFGIQVWNDFGGYSYIEYNIINDNLYDGFYPYLGTTYLRNNTIVDNGRDGYNDWSGGGAVYIQNNVIADNGRYGIYKHLETPVFISYNDVWNNPGGAYMYGYSGPAQPFIPNPGTGEIAADPLFAGAPFDYYISWWNFPTPDSTRSPCIDAGNPVVQFNDPDGTRNDMGALYFDQTYHNISIEIDAPSPPVIPPGGGSFTYSVAVSNNEANTVAFEAWIMVTLPSGTWYGPVLGPLALSLPGGIALNRLRTQNVPGSAPAGSYIYSAYVGVFPTTVWDWDSLSFTKSLTGDGALIGDWNNIGEEFDLEALAVQPASLLTPTDFKVSAYPNPFNPSTAFSFELRAASFVSLRVYDTTGRLVGTLVEGWREAGEHRVTFDGSGLAAGVYLYRLSAGEQVASGKLILLK